MGVIPTAQTNQTKDQAFRWGAQDRIVIVAVPAGASPALVGQQLQGQALTVNGDYECLIPMSGLKDILEVHVTATLATKTASTALDSLFYVPNPADPSTWVNKQAGSGDGALVSTTRQSSSIATPVGEQFARLTLTVAGAAGSVAITQAEYNGI
jgi:hypothetical protein